MGSGIHEPPYPRGGDGDFVTTREFEQLARRVERIETKQIGESLVRVEERQQNQATMLAEMKLTQQQMAHDISTLKDAETKRVALKLGTKGLIAFIVGLVGLAGTIVGIIVALASGGG